MKKFFPFKQFKCLFCILPVLLASINISFSQNNLTADKWKEDLIYVQKIIETKYSNLFYKVTKDQFDSAVSDLSARIPVSSENEIRLGFMKLIAMFKYGHTHMGFRYGEGDNPAPLYHYIPVRFYYFSDSVYISRISSKYKDALGGRV